MGDNAKLVMRIASGVVVLGCAVFFAVYRLSNPDMTEMRTVLNNIPVVIVVLIACGVLIWSKD